MFTRVATIFVRQFCDTIIFSMAPPAGVIIRRTKRGYSPPFLFKQEQRMIQYVASCEGMMGVNTTICNCKHHCSLLQHIHSSDPRSYKQLFVLFIIIMTVHSFHIFDRKGKTLFTKRYIKDLATDPADDSDEQLSEQRKLIFGMLFSLRELSSSLSSEDGPGDLQLVKTGATTLYNYETVSGLRFVLYTTAETSVGRIGSGGLGTSGTTTTPGGGLTTPGSSNTPQSSIHGTSTNTTTPILTAGSSGATATPITSPPSSNPNSVHGGSSSSTTTTIANTTNMMTSPNMTSNIRSALKHIYEHIWVTFVVRSPLYNPYNPDLKSTNF